jgi:hypothetical protein
MTILALRISTGELAESIESQESQQSIYFVYLWGFFKDGEECPITLWWPVLSEEFNRSYLLIDDFDNADSRTGTSCVAKHLNLSRRNFVNKHTNCSTHFYWRGTSLPTSMTCIP